MPPKNDPKDEEDKNDAPPPRNFQEWAKSISNFGNFTTNQSAFHVKSGFVTARANVQAIIDNLNKIDEEVEELKNNVAEMKQEIAILPDVLLIKLQETAPHLFQKP